MGPDWIDGLRAFISKKLPDADVRLLLESIGFGGAEKEVYEKAEKLLLMEKVDMLIAFVDLRVLPVLEPLLYSTGKLMVVVNPGANYPGNWIPQPNIVYLTLHHAFLCRLTGQLAAAEASAKAAMVTSFYDCGYLHTAAMVNGFIQRGGSITHNHVSNQPNYQNGFDIQSITNFLQEEKQTQQLLCTLDTPLAKLFYQALNNYEAASGLQVFASPMMLQPDAIAAQDEWSFSVTGYLPWLATDTSAANEDFITSYRVYAKKEATIFSLLGWEAGLVLQQALQQQSGQAEGNEIAMQLKKTSLQSPRGAMHLHPETQYFLTPAIRQIITGGKIHQTQLSIEETELSWNEFASYPAEGISSGWTNTYLCY
jgi:branched-chain amino acid transport system substrate-binding protein